MVQLTIDMAKSEDQGGLSPVAGNADHDAVDRALTFHLHPLALPRQIPTVAADHGVALVDQFLEQVGDAAID
jgi:hypothetical protein